MDRWDAENAEIEESQNNFHINLQLLTIKMLIFHSLALSS